MNVTKLEHACLILNNGKSRLFIDPGSFTKLPKDLSGASCIMVTEEHLDHFSVENIKKILSQSPNAQIISTQAVATQLEEAGYDCMAISGTEQINIGGYKLNLTEGDHAVVYGASPCRVLTVTVDDFLYYPSDSYLTTNKNIKVLALPTCGPWHKISEAVDFANNIKSEYVLVTHNGLYNDTGNNVTNRFIENNLVNTKRPYVYLGVGESKKF